MSEPRNTGIRIVSWLVALIFLAAGIPKLFVMHDWLFRFMVWGHPKWLLILVGTLETVGALALLNRKSAFTGAVALTIIMVGAFATLFIQRDGIAMLGPVMMLGLLYIILKKRKPRNLLFWKSRGSTVD